MKILTVAELARLPWNSPVPGVVAVVQMVHPHMGRSGWSLQNGRLVDPAGAPVVEFMLSKHERYWDPAQVKGKRVEFIATQSDDLVWKEQTPKPNVNRGRPFAKLEVAASTRIIFADAPAPSLPGFDPAPAASAPPPLAASPLPPPPPLPSEPAGTSMPALRTQLRQMLGLHAVVDQVVRAEAKAEERAVLREHLFHSACALGLFRGLDPDAIALELDPSAMGRLKPNLARLAELAKGREDTLNLLLRGTGAIRMDATWQTLSESEAARVLLREDLLGVFAKAS